MSLLKTPPKALDERTNAIASLHSPSMRTNNDREGELKFNHRSHSASSGLSEARSPKKRDSKFSVCTGGSVRSHQEYLDTLEVPTSEMVERITAIQERKEAEIRKKRVPNEGGEVGETDRAERERAANLIQRSYRGHRERRIMAGLSLDPTTRWLEAVKEAQYRNLTTPRAKREVQETTGEDVQARSVHSGGTINYARQNWKKIGLITRRAGGDEESDSEGSGDDANTPEHEREERRKREMEAKLKRRQAAKIMDLQYFLEMVDVKHRYGSNLRIYHEEWKRADTKENFFYWLDYGEGRFINCQGCPRERLDREQVRYLSKEERLDYLVKIDKEGRLCWAKNGARIDTTEEYKDSMNGIVPATENAPVFRPADAFNSFQDHPSLSSSTESEEEIDKRADRYATPEVDKAKGVKKVSRISAATIVDKLLRGSVKNNTWIFVADTSFRLYVGIKQSGAFQHSSFLHGSRISAAGSITIKNGRLSKLSPLSGHYRPPVSNFKAFTHSLKEAGVDMSHVSISRSYAVLVGLEAYVKTRRRGKSLMQKLMQGKDKILSREDLAEREEAQRHKRESAAKEQRLPEHKRETDKDNQNARLLEKMHLTHTQVPDPGMRDVRANGVKDSDIQVARTGPENAIASEGRRDA
ncbi:IQ calmodulin-binding motif protein [Drepanopeziza brunnea f. sp. 'multigermtubi' MB_m1]|uniref:IQ calmodulin-binding motif protein n=1 Tax=Marssonina brunnea f. sp. multigermtubi (strain MB_m1) TaxID=1072389 RepID=K1XBU9_MARBU|nr:IQ calmodulin-binding motif protein [Drepanopeziza brunnea f. sp. 'multigermtubi' MB_m1]EKD18203.1 IQ calmodulin-binding motif protein [Drepanopeziza brunnea f. sp. 'multigermtubi' MB_m1]